MAESPTLHPIPWAKPDFWGREKEYVADALSSTWISGGSYLDRLEAGVAGYLGTPHALAVANGTTAIHLAYLAIDLRPGDEVVVPGFCFLAAANIALLMGAVPVFAEVDPKTWCVTAEAIERVLSPRTRAVVPVHSYGNACDMAPIVDLCRDRGIVVIEDAAESFATRYRGQATGAIGDLGTLSFQATKTITTGEGGMVLTARKDLVERLKLYRSHGMLRTRYMHDVAGHNFRLTNLQAALGYAQFERIDDIVAARARMMTLYCEHLRNFDEVTAQYFAEDVDPVLWAVAVRVDPKAFPQGRDAVIAQVGELGIETRPGFYAPTSMPDLYPGPIDIPVCEAISRETIVLPCYPTLTSDEVGRIVEALSRQKK
ncbi:MAG: DegT/DnrJ/EryC1/StrS family aminotransferase [Proteobacteria bacterium]|nr:DegT/DnrJ/EryC1/StrS family aminotransferase [Pseudomonadota bacterium]